MDFKSVSDLIRGSFSLEEQARAFGVSYQHFRRIRTEGKTAVEPPQDWRERMLPLLEEHAAKMAEVLDRLSG